MKKERLKQLLLMTVGTALIALGAVQLFVPNQIVSGGLSGISTILFHIASVPVSLSYAVMNVVLLLIGIKVLGKEFIIKTLLGTALMTMFMELFSLLPPLTEDAMLAAIFGGICYGVGLGLTFVSNGSTGGTDILGRLIQRRFPGFKIGTLLAAIDGVIILTSALIFKETDLILCGIIGLVLQSITLDALIDRLNVAHMVFVVTDHGEYVREYMRKKYDRGVTELEAYGYANEERTKCLLVCVMNTREAAEFKEVLTEVDSEAFVMFTEAKSILGKGFRYYK